MEAQEEGGITQAAATAKHKTKSHFLGVFQKAGKKMAGFHGDVAVDGAKKQVCVEVSYENVSTLITGLMVVWDEN